MQWLKHAFAIDRAGPAEPTPEQHAVIDHVCREVVRRHLTTPSLIFLGMSRTLNYLGAQAMHFFSPFVSAVTGARSHHHLAQFLEQPDAGADNKRKPRK